jgi:acetyltransferase-like isoleucine patch superfamily enzyme
VATVRRGDGVVLGEGCRFEGPGEVVIGEGTVLGDRVVVHAHERVTIGAGCRLGDEVVLLDCDRSFDDVERPVREQPVVAAPVVVGDRVRLGAAAAVLRGVTIGDGATVQARSVVTRDVAAGATVEGVPARSGQALMHGRRRSGSMAGGDARGRPPLPDR